MKQMPDAMDLLLLDALRRNARIPHAELAAKVNLSRNAVRRRIERLERDGFILGYTIRQSDGLPQSSAMVALVFVYRHDRMRGGDVLAALRRIPEVVACDVMSGDFDIVLRVESVAPDRIRAIWREISLLPGVRDTLTSIALNSSRRS